MLVFDRPIRRTFMLVFDTLDTATMCASVPALGRWETVCEGPVRSYSSGEGTPSQERHLSSPRPRIILGCASCGQSASSWTGKCPYRSGRLALDRCGAGPRDCGERLWEVEVPHADFNDSHGNRARVWFTSDQGECNSCKERRAEPESVLGDRNWDRHLVYRHLANLDRP